MFRATTSQPELLKAAIATIAEIIDEGVFTLAKDGISLFAADRAMVAIVDFSLSSKTFDSYELDKEQSVGLNITNLLSVLKRVRGGEKLTLELKEGKLNVLIQNASKRRFAIPLLEITQEEVPVDQLEREFSAHVTLRPEVLKAGIEDAEIIADSVVFYAGEKFMMVAEGDISKAELELEKGSDELIEFRVSEEVRARYPLDYLKKMIKASAIADTVSLHFGQDYPMRLDFNSENCKLGFILAPRVAEE